MTTNHEHIDTLISQGKLLHWDKHFALWVLDQIVLSHDHPLLAPLVVLSRLVRDKQTTLFLRDYNEICASLQLEPLQMSIENLQKILQLELPFIPEKPKPVVLRENYLSLFRHARDASDIAQQLWRLKRRIALSNPDKYKEMLNELFPETERPDVCDQQLDAPIDYQRLACCMGLLQQLFVLCGGPGTGKTTSALKLLLTVSTQFVDSHQRPPIIALAAPTGKAATRLAEAINQGKARFSEHPATRFIPGNASTLHRLLKIGSKNRSRYGEDNPLPIDILLVDEVSMIDNQMAAQLLKAISEQCRLILLGDQHQLKPVEAGNLLTDFCQVAGFDHYSEAFVDELASLYSNFPKAAFQEKQNTLTHQLQQNTDVESIEPSTEQQNLRQAFLFGDQVCRLQKSYRFSEQSGIAWLAQSLQESQSLSINDWSEVNRRYNDLEIVACNAEHLTRSITQLCAQLQALYQKPMTVEDLPNVFSTIYDHQILSATRGGQFGCDSINQSVAQKIINQNGLKLHHHHFHLQPILVEENDYQQSLYNGDLGLVVTLLQDSREQLVAAFPGEAQQFRIIPLSRLPQHSSAYAMTVHKSQGSEFTHCTLILSEGSQQASAQGFIDRQLIYTGVTRARKSLKILADLNQLGQQIGRERKEYSELAGLIASYETSSLT